MRTIAIENSAHGITANVVAARHDRHAEGDGVVPGRSGCIRAAILSDRFGRPEEVADLVAFLSGDGAGYITAQEIGIDGGLGLNSLFVGPTQ
ncbi:NAD(P)-dependent dehydrogenase (short-subunit alcohol dehydrogenase family) [Mycobacterium sp. URHB0021]|jgi:NAD(P)-dependent dehydrogenase (short-subunit alcohol dehydrogenase family)